MKNYKFFTKLFMFLMVIFFTATDYAYAVDNTIYSFRIKGVITNNTVDFTKENIKKAEQDNVPLLIYIDTPGGVLESTRDIVKLLLAAKTPVIAYVSPNGARAASAGAFIALAAEYTIMDKATSIGAAHPVNHNGEDIKGEMENKVVNDTVALMKNIANTRNKNVDAAVLMVTESKSYTADEALKLKLVDAVASPQDVVKLLDEKYNTGRTPVIMEQDPTFLQSFYNFLASPDILAVLLILGALLILFEIQMPGTFLFAGLGIISLILFAFGANILPINTFGIVLVILGFLLLGAEIFIPSFGMLTVGGIISLIYGLKMLFEREEYIGVSISLWLFVVIIAITAITAFFIGRLVVKDFFKKPVVGLESMAGQDAEVIEWNNKKGRVRFQGEIWNAVSDEELQIQDAVEIVKVAGLTLHVKKK